MIQYVSNHYVKSVLAGFVDSNVDERRETSFRADKCDSALCADSMTRRRCASRWSTDCDKIEAMNIAVSRERTSPFCISGRAAVCFLLGIFFLYNPFFTICPAPGPSSTMQHPVSYRSTVASSELGCSTTQCEKLSFIPVATVVTVHRLLQQPARDIWPSPGNEPLRATPIDFAMKLWSRPPPIV